MKYWHRCVVSLLCGMITVFAWKPHGYWPVLIVSIGLFYLILQKASSKQAALLGFFFGIGYFGLGISWVYNSLYYFGVPSVLFAGGVTLLFVFFLSALSFASWCAIYGWRTQSQPVSVHHIFLFTSLWVISEIIRGCFASGFPWLMSGYSLLNTVVTAWAPIIGVYGLSLFFVLFSVSLAHVIRYPVQFHASFIFFMCLLMIFFSLLIKKITWTYPVEKPLKFTVIQGNIALKKFWNKEYSAEIMDQYTRLSELSRKHDLIIWPESAIPVVYQNLNEFKKKLIAISRANNNTFIFGVPFKENHHYYNAAVALNGDIEQKYFKQKLVPFGEYFPCPLLTEKLGALLDIPMSNFSAGSEDQSLIKIHGYPVAIYICYEAVYPEFAWQLAKNSAFGIVISNHSWFGKSIGPAQHFQMVRMRAIETGRYFINNSNDYATSVISPTGKVIKRIPSFAEGVLRGKLLFMKGQTPVMFYSSYPVYILCGLFFVFGWKRKEREVY